MKIKKLIEVLSAMPPDAQVCLQVFGHHYGSDTHRSTHGPMVVVQDGSRDVILASDTGGHLRRHYGGRCRAR